MTERVSSLAAGRVTSLIQKRKVNLPASKLPVESKTTSYRPLAGRIAPAAGVELVEVGDVRIEVDRQRRVPREPVLVVVRDDARLDRYARALAEDGDSEVGDRLA